MKPMMRSISKAPQTSVSATLMKRKERVKQLLF